MNSNKAIPASLQIFHFGLSLYAKMEKRELQKPDKPSVAILLSEDIRIDAGLAGQMKDKGYEIGQLSNLYNREAILVVALAGDFYRLDEFKVNQLSTGARKVALQVDYIHVENPDGEPYLVNPYLLMPVDNSWKQFNGIDIRFSAFQKNMISGQLKPVDISLPDIELEWQ